MARLTSDLAIQLVSRNTRLYLEKTQSLLVEEGRGSLKHRCWIKGNYWTESKGGKWRVRENIRKKGTAKKKGKKGDAVI